MKFNLPRLQKFMATKPIPNIPQLPHTMPMADLPPNAVPQPLPLQTPPGSNPFLNQTKKNILTTGAKTKGVRRE